MWEGFIFKSLANCIRFLECSQTTHGQSRAKNSILSLSASSFMTNPVSLSLDPGPKSSCYDIFLTAVCKETSSSKEILTKLQNRDLNLSKCLNCLSARYYWLQRQTKYQIFKQCILDSSCSHPGQDWQPANAPQPLQAVGLIVCRQQCIIDMRQVLGFQATTNLSATVLVSLQLFQTLLPREFHWAKLVAGIEGLSPIVGCKCTLSLLLLCPASCGQKLQHW